MFDIYLIALGSGTNGSVSPRRHRRPRESPRRKTGNNALNAKSPTSGFGCGVSAHRYDCFKNFIHTCIFYSLYIFSPSE